jgi:hypothetical protein
MDTLLIAVTVLSLAMAAAMSLVVLKLLREERRRSDARMAALVEATSAPDRRPAADAERRAVPVARRTAPVPKRQVAQSRESHVARDPSHVARDTSHVARDSRHSPDLPLRTMAPTAELFVEPGRRASRGPQIALAAGAMAVLLGVGFTLLGANRGSASVPPVPATARDGAALELLTLRHTAVAGNLTVSGLVQNPRDGTPLRRLSAVVYALDTNGEVLATNRAPVDLATFGPGEESPFVVDVAVPGGLARYRVGFRTETGDVVAHVDRRAGAESVAHK